MPSQLYPAQFADAPGIQRAFIHEGPFMRDPGHVVHTKIALAATAVVKLCSGMKHRGRQHAPRPVMAPFYIALTMQLP